MTGWMTSLAQSPDLRYFTEMKNPDGSWAYPLVRSDIEKIRSNGAERLFYMEQRAIFAEDVADSLKIDIAICQATRTEKHWYSKFESGVVLGVVLTVSAAWAMGQVAQ
jgi:hypothetical protein